jgi:signal transduction histidine kinase
MPDARRDTDPRPGRLAEEQAALRRVATLVARGVSAEELFSAVSTEVGRLFGAEVAIARFEADGSAMVVVGLTPGIPVVSIGARWPLEGFLASAAVYRTGRPARSDHTGHRNASGTVADSLRQMNFRSTVAAPIMVEGKLWGVLTVSDQRQPLPADTEERVAKFTELVATAIANAESRAALAASEAGARELAKEQAALRRVATLVANAAEAEEVFSAVAQEVARVFDVNQVTVCRYERDTILVLSSFGAPEFPPGSQWPLNVPSLPASIYRNAQPARIDDFTDASGLDAGARDAGVKAAVGVPIVVGGAVWGSINIASTKNERFPPDAEERLARFTDLVATSVSNTTMREELAASRARIVAAADDARRRIGRDLHDGAQQRLVTLTVALRRAEAKIPAGLDELTADVARVAEGLTTAVEELRELSRGIHPSILTEGGLSPALKALGRRSPVRVKLDVRFEHRLPDPVEVAAYYTVSEALTNASKHANPTRVWVSLRIEEDVLLLSIRDDGVGGADASLGSGLTGLRDRIEALGGTLQVESPKGRGTHIEAAIPMSQSTIDATRPKRDPRQPRSPAQLVDAVPRQHRARTTRQ